MTNPAIGSVVISLLRGLISQQEHSKRWSDLLKYRSDVVAYLQIMNLDLHLNESEGYAFIRQKSSEEDEDYPRLVRRHAFSFAVSLLLVLLRKTMLEHDATGDVRVVVKRDQLVDQARPFFGQQNNEPKFMEQIDRSIDRIVSMGFLRPLTGRSDEYEIRRVIAAFVDAQWTHDLQAGLDAYRRRYTGETETTTS